MVLVKTRELEGGVLGVYFFRVSFSIFGDLAISDPG